MLPPPQLSTEDLQFNTFTGFIKLRFKKFILYCILIFRLVMISVSIAAIATSTVDECSTIRSVVTQYMIYEFLCIMSNIAEIINRNFDRSRPDFCTLLYYYFSFFDCIATFAKPDNCPSNSFLYIWFISISVRLSLVLVRLFIYHVMFRCCLSVLIKILYMMSDNHENYQAIQQLPTRIGLQVDTMETCSICLENYSIGDEMKILPCNHYFHTRCIDGWFHIGRGINCPMCRFVALPSQDV
jgi:hypothetical protein